ncbi:hypothetical protein D3C87_20750 [compost metagenome]
MKNTAILPFFVLLLFIQLTACSQEKEQDCKTLLNQQPYIFRQGQQQTMNLDSVKHDYNVLQECGNLDSIDGMIFQGPVLAQLLVSNKTELNDLITYQALIDLISTFKNENGELYQKMRKGTIVRLEIEKMPVELSKFEAIRSKLITAGLTNEEIDTFKSFLETQNKSWNYKEAITAFGQSQNPAASSNQPLVFPELQTLEKLLADAKTKNKNGLLYFSCYGCVNARKFEDQLLKDSRIQKTIQQHFVYKIAYVDNRQKLPGETKTIGEKYTELQKETFKSVSQPILYILSPDGKIIASWSYEDGANTFQSFLEKGMTK